ncbi:MAG: ATP-binding protein, partial [Pseudomonadota bacterium]|nr:ATP-binding protein [Pseudomonadota bacterium]
LENQENALREQGLMEAPANAAAAGTTASGGAADNWNPILIALVRRAMPNLMAYDICGVQPMSGPTGLIFAMKSRYGGGNTSNREALFNEAETKFSGDSSATHDSDNASGLNVTNLDSDSTADDARLTNTFGGGMTTAQAEALGSTGESTFNEMGFTIEKQTVTAKSRALKAEYSLELAQDLKAIHGLDAETELANILSTEILAEINREVVRTINSQAKTGALQVNTAVNGIFDVQTDADGRWSVEKFKGLILQIEREANVIAKETRRGKGNFMICSSDVASALSAAGMLDYSPAMSTNLNVDDTGNTFAGVMNGRMRVYIDPYASTDYVNVGYKGTNPYDAGVFYCPYVPLTMVRAVGEDTFQPKIGFKTRYGMASNPYVTGSSNGLGTVKQNQYYRIFRVDNILGA